MNKLTKTQKLILELAEALMDMVDDYEMENMYSDFRQQLRNGK